MSRRSRLFAGIVVVYLAAVLLLLYRVGSDIDPRYRESSEESLVDTANLLASVLEGRAYGNVIPTDELEPVLAVLAARDLDVQIYDIKKTRIDLHVYVTDARGQVIYDSRGDDLGADYSNWRDVKRTLAGLYGARTTLATPEDASTAEMIVGAAIRERGGTMVGGKPRIIGMVAVGKPVAAIRPYIANARWQLAKVGALSAAAFATLLLLGAAWLVRPFGLIRDLWRIGQIGGGSISSRVRRVAHALRTVVVDLRDALAGRSYVDDYVQTLAHELKSPLAAIRGAAELLHEPLPEAARARFASNINEQVQRAQAMIERLLELSGLERRGALERVEAILVTTLMAQVHEAMAPIAARRQVSFALVDDRCNAAGTVGDVAGDIDFVLAGSGAVLNISRQIAGAVLKGDAFLLHRALGNLVANAIDFAPRGSAVRLAACAHGRDMHFTVRDHGPGLPAFARERLFQKFFSLPRPDTGKKGTGLGLAFVREVAALHGGRVSIDNHPDGGAFATLILPFERAQLAKDVKGDTRFADER